VVKFPRSQLKVRRITISEFLLMALRDAENGLRGNSVDEVDELLERCRIFGRAQWPPEVIQFVDSYKRGRERGRMRSKRADVDLFERNPNRVAAAYAMDLIAAMRPGGKGRYKISTSDGVKNRVTVEAVRRAVEYVNEKRTLNQFDGRKADPAQVAELVRRSRGRYPGT
jgi:hypothetical protein